MFHVLIYCLEIDTFHIKKIYSTQYKTGGEYIVMTGLCAQYISGVFKWQIDCIILPLCILYWRTQARLCMMISHTDKSSPVQLTKRCFLFFFVAFLIFYLSAVCK